MDREAGAVVLSFKFKLISLSAALVSFAFCPVYAQPSMTLADGRGYYAECRDDGGTRQRSKFVDGICYGLLDGYDQYHQVAGPEFYCRPSISRNQLRAIFLKFLRDNPEEWHKETPTLFLSAMQRAYPC